MIFFLEYDMVPPKGMRVPIVCDYDNDMDGTLFIVADVPIVCCNQHSLQPCFDYQTYPGRKGPSLTEMSWYRKQVKKAEG